MSRALKSTIKDDNPSSSSGSDSDSGPEEQFQRGAPLDARSQRRMETMHSMESSSEDDSAVEGEHDDSSGAAGSSGSEPYGSSSDDNDMADVPFEQLAALRAGASVPGAQGAGGAATGGLDPRRRKRKQALQHRENKNRPTETSSRQPIGRLRDVLQAPKIDRKDPRFEDLSGTYNSEVFRKRYSFVFDEKLPAERSSLKAKIRKTRRPDLKEALTEQSAQVDATLREDQLRQKKHRFEADLKAKEKAAVKAGKKPFFLKAADKRKAELVAKYEELRAAGQLDKFLAKRRRKNAAKDHRYVPTARAT